MNKRKSLGAYLNLFLAIAAVTSLPGCAGTYTESVLSTAGFIERTPSTPKQQAIYNSKSIYLYADKKKGVVYIGGEAAYQRAAAQHKQEVTETQMTESAEEAFSVHL